MRRGEVTVIIPHAHAGDITLGVLSRLLRQAGVSRAAWLGAERCQGDAEL